MSKYKIKKYPSVSVIILNFNGLEDTRVCLLSVLKTKYPRIKIYLVDNGSYDNEANILKREFTDKRIIFKRFNKNFGFAGGNNKILKEIKTDYVVLLNNDTETTRNWLEELITVAESDKYIAVCQPKIKSFYQRQYFEYAGAAGGYLDKLGYPYARGRIGFHLEKDEDQYNKVKEIFWGSGTCILIRSKVLLKSGLLPEDFFFYHEETDLCWRIKGLGYKIVFCPDSVIYHKGGGASNKEMKKRIYFVHRNALLLIARNLSVRKLIWIMPLRVILDWFSGLFYLMNGKPQFLMSLLKAHVSFFYHLSGVIRYRKKMRKKMLVNVENLMFPTSIFWEYFVNNRRRFSEIDGKASKTKIIYYRKMINIDAAIKNKKIINLITNSRIFIHLLMTLFLLSLTLFLYSGLFNTYFQQDEWYGFGQAIYAAKHNFSNVFSLIGGYHFTPFSALAFFLEYYIFGLNPFGYALISLILFVVSALFIFDLANMITRNKKIAALSSVMFVVLNTHLQAVTWFAATLNVIPATILGILSLKSFLIFNKKRDYKYLFCSLALLIFSLGFKEDTAGLFLFYIVLLLVQKKKEIKEIILILLPTLTYGLFRMNQLSNSQTIPLQVNSLDYISNIPLHALLFFFKGFSQLFLPVTLMLDISHLIVKGRENFFLMFSPVNNIAWFVEAILVHFVSISITLFLLIFLCLTIYVLRKDRIWIKIVLGQLFFIFISILPLALLPGNPPMESRHFYFPLVGASILFSFIFFSYYDKIKTIEIKILLLSMLVFFIWFNISLTKKQIDLSLTTSKLRMNFVTQISGLYKKLPEKTIFYATGDTVPFQSGPGEMFMVIFHNQHPYDEFFRDYYLWGMIEQGYRESGGIGFGYYYKYNDLLQTYKKYRLLPENVVSFYWNNNKQEIKDISAGVRKVLK